MIDGSWSYLFSYLIVMLQLFWHTLILKAVCKLMSVNDEFDFHSKKNFYEDAPIYYHTVKFACLFSVYSHNACCIFEIYFIDTHA